MLYAELERDILYTDYRGILKEGSYISGQVRKVPVSAEIVFSTLMVTRYLPGGSIVIPANALILDSGGLLRTHTAIVPVHPRDAGFLESFWANRRQLGEGAMQDLLSDLYHQAKELDPLRKTGHKSLGDRLRQLLPSRG